MGIILHWARCITAIAVFTSALCHAEEKMNFHPNESALVFIEVKKEEKPETPEIKEVQYRILFGKTTRSESIQVETLHNIRIDVNDYNFDGMKDFSINYLDDGWGTYEITRIFLFSSVTAKFNEVFPNGKDCAGEFISMKIDHKARAILSSNYDGREKGWFQCKSILPTDPIPSFNCANAKSSIEKIICSSDKLSHLDALAASNYKNIKFKIREDMRKQLTADQRLWLRQRNTCKSPQCVETSYRNRINELCKKYHPAPGQTFDCISSDDAPF